MFEYRITLDEDDYLLFNRYHLLNSPGNKKNLRNIRLIVPLMCLVIVLILLIAGSDSLLVLIEAILMAIFSILWLVFNKQILLKLMERNIKRLKKEGKLPYNKEAVLKFDDEGIHEITPDTESKTKYSKIEKIAVTDKAIYIYYSTVQAYLLPVTAFSEEMEKTKFLEFINSKTGILGNIK